MRNTILTDERAEILDRGPLQYALESNDNPVPAPAGVLPPLPTCLFERTRAMRATRTVSRQLLPPVELASSCPLLSPGAPLSDGDLAA